MEIRIHIVSIWVFAAICPTEMHQFYSPQNIAVSVDQPIVFSCGIASLPVPSSMIVHWKYTVVGSTTGKQIICRANGNRMATKFGQFHLNNSLVGQYDLETPRVRFTDAGTYFCEIGTQHVASAELVVLDDQPECVLIREDGNSSRMFREGEPVGIECVLRYRGNWAPVIQWKFNQNDGGADLSIKQNTTTRMDGETSMIISVLTVTTESSMHGSNFSCGVNFDPQTFEFSHEHATNVPKVDVVWFCPAIMLFENHIFHTDGSNSISTSSLIDSGSDQTGKPSVDVLTLSISFSIPLILMTLFAMTLTVYLVRIKRRRTERSIEKTGQVSHFYNEIVESEMRSGSQIDVQIGYSNLSPREENVIQVEYRAIEPVESVTTDAARDNCSTSHQDDKSSHQDDTLSHHDDMASHHDDMASQNDDATSHYDNTSSRHHDATDRHTDNVSSASEDSYNYYNLYKPVMVINHH